jgi:hypothetical protein
MESDIQRLDLASGIKDSLINAGFTVSLILNSNTIDISERLGIDLYVAKIIFEEAKKIRNVATTDAISTTAAVNKDNDYNNKYTYMNNAYAYHILVHNHSPRITL